MPDKRALIFGAAGFVGPYLASALAKQGYEVFGVDNKDYKGPVRFARFFVGNILDKDGVAGIVGEVKPTHIVNLAAISSVGLSWKIPSVTMDVNVCGAIHIFEGCLAASIKPRVLLVGSSEEYAPSKEPINEQSPTIANNPYGISKVGQESFAAIYRERYGFDVLCTRSFNHTGIGQAESFVLPNFCKQVAEIEKGKAEPIVKVGNLSAVRDFSDVRDVVDAYVRILESGKSGDVYNVGSGRGYSLENILHTIVGFSTKSIRVETDPERFRPVDNPIIVCDASLLKNELGWKPRFRLEETLKAMFDYFMGE